MYQKDIEREFRVSKSTVTEILQLMEKNGFIVRESSRRDGRMKRILPTEKSFAIQMDVRENIRMAEEKLRAGIGDEDFHTCLMVLKQMSENLSREEKEMNLCGHAAQNKEIPQGDTFMAFRPNARKGAAMSDKHSDFIMLPTVDLCFKELMNKSQSPVKDLIAALLKNSSPQDSRKLTLRPTA